MSVLLLLGKNRKIYQNLMQIQALSKVPEKEYVYYANWRVISGGYMSISISALLISKPFWGEILSVGAFLFSTCVFKTPENVLRYI